MKVKAFACLFTVFLIIFSIQGFAEENDDIIKRQKEEYGVNSIENSIPEAAKKNASEYGDLSIDNASGIINPQNIFSFSLNAILTAVKSKSGLILQLTALSFLMWLFNVFCESGGSPELKKILRFVTVAAATAIVFNTLFETSQKLITDYNTLLTFMGSLIPVLLGLTAAGGYAATATAAAGTASFGLSAAAFAVNSLILPLTSLYLATGIAAAMTNSVDFSRISSGIKKGITLCFGGYFCIFSAVMVTQKYISLSGDSLTRRTVKLAAGSFLPLAGVGISEGVDTAFACASALRGSVGGLGIAVLLFTVLPPILEIVSCIAVLSIARIVCGFFEDEALSSFFNVVGDVFTVLLTVSCLAAVIIFLVLTVLVRI